MLGADLVEGDSELDLEKRIHTTIILCRRNMPNLQAQKDYFFGVADLAEDTVADPVVIPPLDRIYLYAIHLNRVMDMVAAGQSRGSASYPSPALLRRSLRPYIDLAHVTVDTLQTPYP